MSLRTYTLTLAALDIAFFFVGFWAGQLWSQ